MSYAAEDIARVLIREYIELKSPTTNMKLQKMLYYSWVEYYREKKKYLFDDNIYAWKFGPVVKAVYFNYRVFAAMPITKCDDPQEKIDSDTLNFLSKFAKKYEGHTACGLVFSTHKEGTPWSVIYEEGKKNVIIPFEQIVDLECLA